MSIYLDYKLSESDEIDRHEILKVIDIVTIIGSISSALMHREIKCSTDLADPVIKKLMWVIDYRPSANMNQGWKTVITDGHKFSIGHIKYDESSKSCCLIISIEHRGPFGLLRGPSKQSVIEAIKHYTALSA